MKTLILILSIIFNTSCSSDDEKSTAQSTPINFTEIGKGNLTGNGSEGITQSNLVITNENDWENLKIQMNSENNVTDNFTDTTIDFNSYQIIAIFSDIKGDTRYSISINEIIETSNSIDVYSELNNVGSGFTQIVQPFHIVKIPVKSKPIIFE